MPVEIALPFHVGSNGRIATVSDSDVIVRQHVFSLVNTYPPERVTYPGYGVNLVPLVFENMDAEDVRTQVGTRVGSAVAAYEPGVELVRVKVDENVDENIASVDIDYARRDSADSGSFANSNTVIISANGSVREIVRG